MPPLEELEEGVVTEGAVMVGAISMPRDINKEEEVASQRRM
jgi:hypothetical protein